jgi:hypothetical protein
MAPRFLSRFIALSLSLFLLIGCSSLFNRAPAAGDKRTGDTGVKGARGQVEGSSPVIQKKLSGIEVMWEVPSDPVDGFVIRYGEERDKLNREATIFRSELREENDSDYGPVYRYVLRDVPSGSRIFVAVAAFKGEAVSEFSDIVAEATAGRN